MNRRVRAADVHDFVDDLTRDHRGEGRCVTCRTPQRNDRHNVPDTHDAQAAVAARYDPQED